MKHERSVKRWLITIYRLIITGIRNLFRNAWLSIAAMAVMFVALTILLSSVFLNVMVDNAVRVVAQSFRVSIYLEDDITAEDRFALENDLGSSEFVADIEYVSKDEARQRFSERFAEDEGILEGFMLAGDDALQASYEVSASSIENFNDIADIAQSDEHQAAVESITLGRTDAQSTIDAAARIQANITAGSVFAVITFTVISVLIIFNTIRIAIFTRNEEIRNMKLIGATPWYIRGPFLVEACFYGIIAAILSVITVYSVLFGLGPGLAEQEEFQSAYELLIQPGTIVLSVIATVFAGVVVGALSSMLAMRKYLRLKHW